MLTYRRVHTVNENGGSIKVCGWAFPLWFSPLMMFNICTRLPVVRCDNIMKSPHLC